MSTGGSGQRAWLVQQLLLQPRLPTLKYWMDLFSLKYEFNFDIEEEILMDTLYQGQSEGLEIFCWMALFLGEHEQISTHSK